MCVMGLKETGLLKLYRDCGKQQGISESACTLTEILGGHYNSGRILTVFKWESLL